MCINRGDGWIVDNSRTTISETKHQRHRDSLDQRSPLSGGEQRCCSVQLPTCFWYVHVPHLPTQHTINACPQIARWPYQHHTLHPDVLLFNVLDRQISPTKPSRLQATNPNSVSLLILAGISQGRTTLFVLTNVSLSVFRLLPLLPLPVDALR